MNDISLLTEVYIVRKVIEMDFKSSKQIFQIMGILHFFLTFNL